MKKNKYRVFPAALLTALLLSSCGSARTAEIDVRETEDINIDDILTDVSDADKQTVYLAYLQDSIKENLLEPLPEIEKAAVSLTPSGNTDVLVNVMLNLDEELTTYNASELADMLAVFVGNESTDNITILDSENHMLFPEGE